MVAHLEPVILSGHHRRLAFELEASGRADPEAVAVHFLEAGETERACDYYAAAATQAAEALAFERAAALYRLALELRPQDSAEGRRLRRGLGEALANAGRRAGAATELLAAAEGASDAEALELRRRATMQLLISGHVDDGLATLRELLRAVGIGFPSTPWRVLVSLIWSRARLLFRGVDYHSRAVGEIPREELIRIDICWSAAIGLSNIDVIRGADFQARGLLMALKGGDPFRIARSLTIEAAHASTADGPNRKRPTSLFRAAGPMVKQVDHPYTTGLLWLAEGFAAYFDGRFRNALDIMDQAEEHFLRHCLGAVWEIDSAVLCSILPCGYGGGRGTGERRSALVRDAQDRGDLYAEANLCTYGLPLARLGNDEPDEADRELRHIMTRWSQRGFHLQHHNALFANVMIELYRSYGAGPRAWELIQEKWTDLKASYLLQILLCRVDMFQCRGRGMIAAALSSAYPMSILRYAEDDARRLEARAIALAHSDGPDCPCRDRWSAGKSETARVHLISAAERFNAPDMGLWEWAARRRLGALIGGDEGRDWVARADAWMAGQTIRNPARMTAMLCPGFSE